MTVEEFLSKYNLRKEEKIALLDYLQAIRIRNIVNEINQIKVKL